MTKPILACPRKLPGQFGLAMRAKYDVREPQGEVASLVEFAALAEGAGAVFLTAFDEATADVIHAMPSSVGLIASIGVGVDHIDLNTARAKGLMVSNTPDVTTPCLADTTMGLIIAACRRFREGLDVARTGEGRGMLTPESWGQRVTGRTLGIVGMGNMGRAVAQRARAFDMEILYTTPRPSADLDAAVGGRSVDLETLLRQADVVSLHCPLKPETHHLIDDAAIALMKPSAVIINISRGPIIDELAMIRALKEGRLFAAGLDVFETEPGPIREELIALPNAYCLPHIASATMESRMAMAARVLENIDAFFATGAPRDRVI
ncbi:MAG: D-glycerate dehydrogenase [Alphaproteobacteria bacterium]|nr:D-glycerate dehydrogenase [Alphaproteobacteria bacterium]